MTVTLNILCLPFQNKIDDYRLVFVVSISLLRKILNACQIKYMELMPILSLMYVKETTSLCQVLKMCRQKKIGSFFLPHGV